MAGIDALAEPARVRRRIGVVGQRHGSDPQATGRENLELQGTLYGLHGHDLRQRVDAMLERLDIAHAAGRPVRTYSGRACSDALDVAMGLMHDPAVLFLDEPAPASTRRRAGMSGGRSGALAQGTAALTHPADDALPGGGGRLRRPGGNHGPRPDRRRGNAGPAQALARRGLDPHPTGGATWSPRTSRPRSAASTASPTCTPSSGCCGPAPATAQLGHPPSSQPLPMPGSRSPR